MTQKEELDKIIQEVIRIYWIKVQMWNKIKIYH